MHSPQEMPVEVGPVAAAKTNKIEKKLKKIKLQFHDLSFQKNVVGKGKKEKMN